MARAYVINTTGSVMSVNLNAELDNHRLEAVTLSGSSLDMSAWPAGLSAFAQPGVLGTACACENTLVVFLQGAQQPLGYGIKSEVSPTLDVFLYVMGDTVVGSDQTGATSQISVERLFGARLEMLLTMIPEINTRI